MMTNQHGRRRGAPLWISLLLLSVPALFGFDSCGPKSIPPTEDAGTPAVDSGTPTEDAGTPTEDAGTPGEDAGMPTVDAGMGCGATQLDCDGDPSNGCEVDVSADDANCGACGNVCLPTRHCEASACVRDHAILQVALGYWHSCALRDDEEVLCWGFNDYGQLGDGTAGGERAEPAVVLDLPPAAEVTAASRQTCARTTAGEVWCWGAIFHSSDRAMWTVESRPVQVPGLSNIVAIDGGAYHVCALRDDGQVFCWGANGNSQMGDGTRINHGGLTPVQPVGMRDIIAVQAGGASTMVLRNDGRTFGWGANHNNYELGVASTTTIRTPIEGPLVPNIASLSFRSSTGCALDTGGEVTCWGYGIDGNRADGTFLQRSLPVATMGLSGTAEIAAGACARKTDGRVFCWGNNENGRLGIPSTTLIRSNTPVEILGLSGAVEIDAGAHHACARTDTGDVLCWGSNGMGQIGNGGSTIRTAPTNTLHGAGATQLAPGGLHTCGVWASGEVRCWGANDYGQLGDGTTSARLTAPAVLSLTDIEEVQAGAEHSCARSRSGQVSCWGNNARGQLGDGSTTSALGPVTTSITDATALSLAPQHGCALRAGGAVSCWGDNARGQLGDGTTTDRSSPVAVPGLSDAIAVAAGTNHSCALRATGEVLCWGGNEDGALGDGTTTDRPTPGAVPGVAGAVAIGAGEGFSCALLGSGQVICWGANESGRLGAGLDTYEHPDPIALPDLTDATHIAIGSRHGCALRTSGEAVCWGDYGLLGTGRTDEHSSPTPVVGLASTATTIWAGSGHSCAPLASGAMVCWGFNGSGQLGDGIEGIVLRPVPVLGL